MKPTSIRMVIHSAPLCTTRVCDSFIFASILLLSVSFSAALVLNALGDGFAAYDDKKKIYFILSFSFQVAGYCCYIFGAFPRLPLNRKTCWFCSIVVLLSMTTIIHFVLFDVIKDRIGVGFVLWGIQIFQIILIACFFNTPDSRRQCKECHNISIYGSFLLYAATALRLIDRYITKIKADQYLLISMHVLGLFFFYWYFIIGY